MAFSQTAMPPLSAYGAGTAKSRARAGAAAAAAGAPSRPPGPEEKHKGKNPVGVHALVWCGDWSREGAALAISSSEKCGFDIVEVPMFDPQGIDTDMTRHLLQEAGLRAATSLGLSPETDISSPDADVSAAGEEFMRSVIQASSAFGAEYVVGVIHSALMKYSEPATPAGRRNLVNAYKRLAVEAEDRGITIGLEVVNRYETNVLNTAAQAMHVIDEIGHRNVTVHLDTYHMNIEEESMARAVQTCGDRLGYVHIGESHRGKLGSGSVDWKGLFDALADVDYQGPLTFESFSSAIVSADLSNNLCVWRNLWSDSMELATHAKCFIDSRVLASRALKSP